MGHLGDLVDIELSSSEMILKGSHDIIVFLQSHCCNEEMDYCLFTLIVRESCHAK